MGQVFIGWSGGMGKNIAESLAKTLLSVPGVRPWVSGLNIESGKQWLRVLEETLQNADQAIICVTPNTLGAPWLNFEAGIAYGRLKRIFVLTVGETIPPNHPFSTIQVLNGRKLNDVKKLMRALLPDNESFADDWTAQKGQLWIAECDAILGKSDAFLPITTLLQSIQVATRELESNAGIFANPLFHFVVKQSLNAIAVQLNGVVSEYSVSSELYPEYLAAMQQKFKPTVKALALVEQEEFFWRGQLGKTVLDTISSKASQRIFALSNSRQCIDFMPTLLQHAHKYHVRVIPLAVLMKEQPRFSHDFSIIDAKGEKLLATYIDQGPHRRNIQFSMDATSLAEHEEAYDIITEMAVRVEDRKYTESEITNLWENAEENISYFERKTVEMSRYIRIHEYDQHEEKHAYFADMMSAMTDIVAKSAQGNSKLRVLEFGAGTGIFTSRLAALPFVDHIVAVEYDWACCEILRHKMRHTGKVHVEYQDSRTFSAGTFDVIVSSFADHHIRPVDKPRYFKNVANNMRPGAQFIVGDEFLPEYDAKGNAARGAALEAYHRHIIDLALKQGETAVAALEEAALKSGLDEEGDFKLPCSSYEKMLQGADFHFTKTCIGPLDLDHVGGVYVYKCSRQ